MARYKHVDYGQMKLVPVSFAHQILPGSFEYALSYLIDQELDLSAFEARFRNDEGGAPAYSPAVLLKIVLLAYSKGIVSSRAMEAACRENVLFMAISGDSQPHFTTLAEFISTLGEAIAKVFTQVLVVCNRQGLIGREMYAIDGVKLPSNASKAKSGTRQEFEREVLKMEAAVAKILRRHRDNDAKAVEPEHAIREQRQLERLGEEARKIRRWLNEHPEERRGPKGSLRQSNRTDNESAKMATGKGVIQGYTGVAAVDEKHQIIVEAQAHGVGQEQELLVPMIEALQPQLAPESVITADAGYHSAANLAELERRSIDAYIPDAGYRKRDPRFAAQQRHRDKPDPLYDKTPKPDKPQLFSAQAFRPAEDLSHCLCPAGKRLYRNGRHHDLNGLEAVKFTGTKRDCMGCSLRSQCLRHPQSGAVRQVAIFLGRAPGRPESPTERMRRKVDGERGREMMGRRFATSEPVFGNLRYNKRLNRFTLRGRAKVDGQWKLCCLVHNIEQLAHHGYVR
jgi:transposase